MHGITITEKSRREGGCRRLGPARDGHEHEGGGAKGWSREKQKLPQKNILWTKFYFLKSFIMNY
jgi:hypothetical protein